jgi:hypothetical protein
MRHEILTRYYPYTNEEDYMIVELVNLVDSILQDSPELRELKGAKDLCLNIISDYLTHISKRHLLSFPHKSKDAIKLKLGGILTNDGAKKEFNNKVLAILKEEMELMRQDVIATKNSNLVVVLENIDINHVDRQLYLSLLHEITTNAVEEYSSFFTEYMIRDIITLLCKQRIEYKIKIVDRLIEIRDTILSLMELHHCPDVQSLTREIDVENPFESLTNEHLFNSYLQMISSFYAIDEIRMKQRDGVVDLKPALNTTRMYKYLYDSVVMNHVINYKHTGEPLSDIFENPEGWDKDYVKSIFICIDKMLSERHPLQMRNNIFQLSFHLINSLEFHDDFEQKQDFDKQFDGIAEDTKIDDNNIDPDFEASSDEGDSDEEHLNRVSSFDLEIDYSMKSFDQEVNFVTYFNELSDVLSALVDLTFIKLYCPFSNPDSIVYILKETLEVLSNIEEIEDLDYKLISHNPSTQKKISLIISALKNVQFDNTQQVKSLKIDDINSPSPGILFSKIVEKDNFNFHPIYAISERKFLYKHFDEELMGKIISKFEESVNKSNKKGKHVPDP